MRTSTTIKVAAITVLSFTLAGAAVASVFGAWPSGSGIYWNDYPVPPFTGIRAGTNYVGSDGYLWMDGIPSTAQKLTWPYGGTWGAEKSSLTKLVLNPGASVTSVHVKLLDQWTTGSSGWAVILEDAGGKILDFGVRIVSTGSPVPPNTGTGKIVPREYDGSTWINGLGGANYYGRDVVNPKYYTMDFVQNPSGTITWTIGTPQGVGIPPYTNTLTSTTIYGNITGVYLSALTGGSSSTVRYKVTEFWANPIPEPSAVLSLGAGLVVLTYLARRKRK